MDWNEIYKRLEPESIGPVTDGITSLQLQISIAISAKRHADAIERLAEDLRWCTENGFPVS